MNKAIHIKEELIAPCGMNCAICSNYLAYVNNLNRSQCTGCRPGNKKCTYLFAKCTGINSVLDGNATAKFCSECDQYPCKEIKRLEKRYRKYYKMSVMENLESISKKGMNKFLKEQYEKYKCNICGELKSVHNGKCFKCEAITKLVDKNHG